MLLSQSWARPPMKMASQVVCRRVLLVLSFVRVSGGRSPHRGEPRVAPSLWRPRFRSYSHVAPSPLPISPLSLVASAMSPFSADRVEAEATRPTTRVTLNRHKLR